MGDVINIQNGTLTRNICRVFRSASADQIADGIAWYGDAHTTALVLAGRGGDVSQAAGVIAALSPQMPWDRNVRLAQRLYAEGFLIKGALVNSMSSAQRIYDGEDWNDVFSRRALKVRAFATCITNPIDPSTVCVDRHAADIARNVVSGKDAKALGVREYHRLADAYRRAAAIVGVSPAQMQAITWVVWRETRIRTSANVRRQAGRAA